MGLLPSVRSLDPRITLPVQLRGSGRKHHFLGLCVCALRPRLRLRRGLFVSENGDSLEQ